MGKFLDFFMGSPKGVFMRKRALALWPRKLREEPEQALLNEPEKWVQEEEVQKLRLQEESQHPNERLQQLLPGMDLKRLVL
ncbi:MAG: hypothetical protein HC883_01945 [Bdellovibrionaceae bacterium]|nr:hypothetical protein [Pseudobdellovibrionaceae bacterium]